jgi:hypothetical protein
MSIAKKKARTNAPYKEGELEVILSMVPTENNIKWLSRLLERSEAAIEIVYKIAYGHGPSEKMQVYSGLTARS